MRAASLYVLLGLWAGYLAGCSDGGHRLGGLASSREGSGGTVAEGGVGGNHPGDSGGAGPGGSNAGSSGSDGGAGTSSSGGAAGSLPDAGGAGSSVGGAGGSFPVGGAAGGSGVGGAAGGQDVVSILDSSGGISAVLADEAAVYFNDWGGDVWRVDHSGLDLRQLADDRSYFLVADETHVYWSTNIDIRRVPKAGGATELVMTIKDPTSELAAATDLAVDTTYVYASTYDDGTVVRAPKTGGTPEVVARAGGTMGGIAVVERTLFWADYGGVANVHRTELASGLTSVFFHDGGSKLRVVGDDLWIPPMGDNMAIVRAPLAGGATTRHPFGSYTTQFDSDGLHVYWCWEGLRRINLATNAVETIADAPFSTLSASGLAVTRHFVFVGNSEPSLSPLSRGSIYRVAKPAP